MSNVSVLCAVRSGGLYTERRVVVREHRDVTRHGAQGKATAVETGRWWSEGKKEWT